MPYQLIHSEIRSSNQPLILPTQITVPTLAIEVRNRSQRNLNSWRSAGRIQAISSANVGEVFGEAEWVSFGQRTEYRMEVPAYPYQLRFTPNKWVYAWEIQLFIKDRSGSDGTPTVPLSEAESTPTGWVIWQ